MVVNQLIIKLKDTIVMEITKDKITEFFCIIDEFCQEYDKKLHACPFVSRTGVSSAIENGHEPLGNHDNTHLFSFQHFPQLQALLPFLCQGSPARPVPQAAFI